MSGPAYTDPGQPPPRSGKSWIWIVLGVLLLLALVCAGACGGCMLIASRATTEGVKAGRQMLHMIEVQAKAMDPIRSHEEVNAKIGAVTGFGPPEAVGDLLTEGSSITCRFDVNGENGVATATVSGSRGELGDLRPTDIEVKFADGTTVDIQPADGPAELNFDIQTEPTPQEEP